MDGLKRLFKDKRFRVALVALLIATAVNRGIVATEDADALKDSFTTILEALLTP